ncbi:hypothetical protein POM88_028723 [Heracleum sosnowskyi]|uniref:Uncharacterized protein n=1 Tax=Heracleum sosnowskyi TaxID=360622 RepID=A0AAD8HSK7_9APIA|nr:hypothetical protein POM88_028723 [Heracleum sosnowskyi]
MFLDHKMISVAIYVRTEFHFVVTSTYKMDHKSFWKDVSNFVDISGRDWFISSRLKDVTVAKPPCNIRVLKKSEHNYYLDAVRPILLRRLAKTPSHKCDHLGVWLCNKWRHAHTSLNGYNYKRRNHMHI